MAGIILAGGYSQRMGRDKALLPLAPPTSLTFVEHLASLLISLCTEVYLVARDVDSGKVYTTLSVASGWQMVYDLLPGQGPLMGLYSGLQAISTSHALVLAVDLPFVQPALLKFLRDLPLTDELLIPRVQQIPQMLLARYPRAALPALEACLRQGRRDLRALLANVSLRFLEEDTLRSFDPALRSFLNINTPEEWQQHLSDRT
jgi:molybdopterin-guanine dinucleotide biosynthesis protein A